MKGIANPKSLIVGAVQLLNTSTFDDTKYETTGSSAGCFANIEIFG